MEEVFLSEDEIVQYCCDFVMDDQSVSESVLEMLKSPDTIKNYGILVDFLHFMQFNSDVGQYMAFSPKKILRCFDAAIGRVQQTFN